MIGWLAMSDGPIEFLSDEPVRKVGDTEFGGRDGLIQPELDPLGGPGHELDAGEIRGVMARAGSAPLDDVAGRSGVANGSTPGGGTDGTVVDPVTGRSVGPDKNQDVTNGGAKFSDLKP